MGTEELRSIVWTMWKRVAPLRAQNTEVQFLFHLWNGHLSLDDRTLERHPPEQALQETTPFDFLENVTLTVEKLAEGCDGDFQLTLRLMPTSGWRMVAAAPPGPRTPIGPLDASSPVFRARR